MRSISLIAFLLGLGAVSANTQDTVFGALHGIVVSQNNGKPIPGAMVLAEPTGSLVETDSEGRFGFPALPVGKHGLYVRGSGHASRSLDGLEVHSGMGLEVYVELMPLPSGSPQDTLRELQTKSVTATARTGLTSRGHEATGTYRLTRQEIISMPGTQLDISRAMQFLPGMNRSNDLSTDLVVRGGAPDEVAYLIDGVPLFSINHFEFGRERNGSIGNLNMYFLDRIDFHNGAFAARYPDRLSGIMDINFKRGNPDRVSGLVIADLVGTGGYLEGPIPATGRASTFGFTWRYSSLDLISKAGLIDFEGIPAYQNGHLKVSHKAGAGMLHINMLAAKDEFDGDEMDDEYRGTPYFSDRVVKVRDYATSQNLFGSLKWQQPLGPGDWDLFAAFNRREEEGNRSRRYEPIAGGPAFAPETTKESMEEELGRLSWGTDYRFRMGGAWTWVNGAYQEYNTVSRRKDYDSSLASGPSRNMTLWQAENAFYNLALYSELLYQTDAWDLYGGARGLFDEFSGDWIIGPRLGVKRHFGRAWLLKYGFGMHSQSQASSVFHLQAPPKALPYSLHNVAGAEASPIPGLFLGAEAFLKDTYRLPRFRQNEDEPPLGKTTSRGFDFILRKKLGSLFWMNSSYTYTWNREWYQGDWELTPYSVPHNWTAALGYSPGRSLSGSIRYSFASGSPYPSSELDPASNRLAFEYLLTRRTRSYQRLDWRLDYRKDFRAVSLAAYLEISNLLDRENWFVTADGEGFNYGWTRFPVGGLTLSF